MPLVARSSKRSSSMVRLSIATDKPELTEFADLTRLQKNLTEKLSELVKARPRAEVDEALSGDIVRLEAELLATKDDLVSPA